MLVTWWRRYCLSDSRPISTGFKVKNIPVTVTVYLAKYAQKTAKNPSRWNETTFSLGTTRQATGYSPQVTDCLSVCLTDWLTSRSHCAAVSLTNNRGFGFNCHSYSPVVVGKDVRPVFAGRWCSFWLDQTFKTKDGSIKRPKERIKSHHWVSRQVGLFAQRSIAELVAVNLHLKYTAAPKYLND